MDIIQTGEEIIAKLNIAETFGTTSESLFLFLLCSLTVGFICLTLYYYLGNATKKEQWFKIPYFEKGVISLFVGFTLILVSAFITFCLEISSSKITSEEELTYVTKLLNQWFYIFPFLYFHLVVIITKLKKSKDTEGINFINFLLKETWDIIVFLIFAFFVYIFLVNHNYFSLIIFMLILLLVHFFYIPVRILVKLLQKIKKIIKKGVEKWKPKKHFML